jgi:hypothetical protein
MQQKLPLSLRADRTGHDFSSTPQSARRSARFIWSPARDWFLSIGILFWAHLDLVFSSSQDLAQVRAGNEAGLRYVLPRGDCSNLGFWSVSQFVLVTLTRFSLPCLLVCRRRTWCWYSSRFPLARAQVSSSITTDYHRICRCSRSSVFSV